MTPVPSSPVALLDQLDELRANATPGPWNAATAPAEGSNETAAEYLTNGLRPEEGRPLWVAWAAKDDELHGDDVEYVVPVVTGDGPTSQANAALIVAAVNALPELIAELRKRDAAVRNVLLFAETIDGHDERATATASLIRRAVSDGMAPVTP